MMARDEKNRDQSYYKEVDMNVCTKFHENPTNSC